MGNRSYYLSLQLEHGATAAPTSTSRPPGVMDPLIPLAADGARSAARSWSSESPFQGDSDDDHGVIDDASSSAPPPPCDAYRHSLARRPPRKARPFVSSISS